VDVSEFRRNAAFGCFLDLPKQILSDIIYSVKAVRVGDTPVAQSVSQSECAFGWTVVCKSDTFRDLGALQGARHRRAHTRSPDIVGTEIAWNDRR
jgi:hypothetical protein